MTGWSVMAKEFEKIRDNDTSALIINKWFPGGHLYYYVARPLNMPVVADGALYDLHKFGWLLNNNQIKIGENAYYVAPSSDFTDPVPRYQDKFDKITLLSTISEKRSGKITRYWYIYRLSDAKENIGVQLEQY